MAVNVLGGSLEFDAVVKLGQFETALNRIEQRLGGVTTTAQKEASAIENLVKRSAGAIAGFASFAAATNLVSNIVQVRSQFQQLEVAFNTMLGSKEKANKLLAEVTEFAATTPFELTEVANAAKQLLAFGISADKTKDTLRSLGDVAAGLGQPLGEIAYLFGTIKTQGVAMTIDVRQFAQRGIPIYEALSKVLGVTTEKVGDLITAGKVGFPQIEAAFQSMTAEGSKFGGLMEAQAKTLGGLQSNLADAVAQMFNELGKSSEGVFADIIRGTTSLVKNYEKVISVLKVIGITYGAYRAALIVTNVVEKVSVVLTNAQAAATGRLTVLQRIQAVQTAVLTRVTAILNRVMLANPYVLAATAIAGLIAAMSLLTDSTTAQERAQEQLNDAAEEQKNKIDEIKSKTSELVSIINDETATKFAQVKAFKELQSLYPGLLNNMDLVKFKTLSAEDAQKKFNTALDDLDVENTINKLKATRAEIERLNKLLELERNSGGQGVPAGAIETQKNLETAIELEKKLNGEVERNKQLQFEANTPVEEQIRLHQATIDKLKAQRDEIEKSIDKLEKLGDGASFFKLQIENINLNSLNAQIDAVSGKIAALSGKGVDVIKDKSFFEKQKKDAEAAVAALDQNKLSDKEFSAQKKAQIDIIRKAEKELEKYDTALKHTNKTTDTANKLQAEFNKLLTDGKGLIDNIASAKNAANETGLTDESQKLKNINDRYDDLILNIDLYNKKVDEFNKKNPKSPVQKVGQVLINEVDNARQKELTNFNLKLDADLFKANLDKKQQLFEQFENAKKEIGEDNARQLFEKELGDYKSFLDLLNAERQKLLPKISFGIANEEELGKFKKIVDGISQLQQDQSDEDLARQQKNFSLLLNENTKFNNQKSAINRKYDALQSQTDIDTTIKDKEARKKVLEEERKEKLDALRSERDDLLTKTGFSFVNEDEVKRFQSIISAIDDIQKNQGADDLKRQQANLDTLLKSFVEFNGKKAAINQKFDDEESALEQNNDIQNKDEAFKALQDNRRKELAALTAEQNAFLQNVQVGIADIGEKEKFDAILTAFKTLNDNISKEQRETEVQNLSDLLAATITFNKAKAAINEKYAKMQALLEKKKGSLSPEEFKESLDILKAQKAEELEIVSKAELSKHEAFKEFEKGFDNIGINATKNIIKALEKLKEELKDNVEIVKLINAAIGETKAAVNNKSVSGLREVAATIRDVLGDGAVKLTKSLTITIGQITTAISQVATLLDKTSSTSDKVGSMIGLITFVIVGVRDALLSAEDLADPLQAQIDYYNTITGQIQAQNDLLARQKTLLEDLVGNERVGSAIEFMEVLKQKEKDSLQTLKDLKVEVIKSQKEVFVDPLLGTEVSTGGINALADIFLWGGQAKRKMKFELESVDTTSLQTIEDFAALLAEIKAGGGKLGGKVVIEDDIKALELLIQTYDQAVEEQKRLKKELDQLFTGTTASNIADSIIDGFKEGKKGAADFAGTFEDLMRGAIFNALKFQALEGPLKEFYAQFAEHAESDGVLSDDEIKLLRERFNSIITDAGDKFDELQKITNIDLTGSATAGTNSLSGAIKGITEQTAQLVAGQFGGLRLTALDHLIVARQQMEALSRIQVNTGQASERLLLIYDRLFYYYEVKGVKVL